MKTLIFMLFLSLNFIFGAEFCTYKASNLGLFIELRHNCPSINCDKVLAVIYDAKNSLNLSGNSKGASIKSVEFSFKNGLYSYIIRQNELFFLKYNQLEKSVKLTPCEGGELSLEAILANKGAF